MATSSKFIADSSLPVTLLCKRNRTHPSSPKSEVGELRRSQHLAACANFINDIFFNSAQSGGGPVIGECSLTTNQRNGVVSYAAGPIGYSRRTSTTPLRWRSIHAGLVWFAASGEERRGGIQRAVLYMGGKCATGWFPIIGSCSTSSQHPAGLRAAYLKSE